MSDKFLDFSDLDLESLDKNEIFEMSMKVTSEFSPEKLLEFISDKIYRLEIILDGYFEANVMNPQDTLAMKNLYSSLECFYFIENWIKLNVLEEEDSILDNTNDDL